MKNIYLSTINIADEGFYIELLKYNVLYLIFINIIRKMNI